MIELVSKRTFRRLSLIGVLLFAIASWNTCDAVRPSAPPSSLNADPASGGRVDLHWSDPGERESEFRVERKRASEPDTAWSEIIRLPAEVTGISDTELDSATTYAYRVRACTLFACSAYSRTAVVKTLRAVPDRGVELYGVFETDFTASGEYSNPYAEASMKVAFTGPSGESATASGFWDGGSTWRVRFRPSEVGSWRWSSTSADPGLDGETGEFEVAPSSAPPPVRVSSRYPFTFERLDGAPFFWMADTNWDLFNRSTAWPRDFKTYVDDRADKKFTVLQTTIEPTRCGARAPRFLGQNERGCVFTKGDWRRGELNPSFFQNLDRRISYVMNETNLAIVFWLIWAQDWEAGFTDEAFMRYAQYCIARYGAYNVLFGLSGEYNEAMSDSAANRVGAHLDTIDPYGSRLTIHPSGGGDTGALSNTWIDFNQLQLKTNDPSAVHSAVTRLRSDSLPVILSETCYEDQGGRFGCAGLDEPRVLGWTAVTSGGFYSYGHDDVSVHEESWKEDLAATIANQMTLLRTFWDGSPRLPWEKMVPCDSCTDRGYLLRWSDSLFVNYLPTGGPVALDLSDAGGKFRWRWYDPRTGMWTVGGTVEGGGIRSFESPDSQDWVLHVTR